MLRPRNRAFAASNVIPECPILRQDQAMAFITFVTTCRGRLAHLRETLPSLVAQPDASVVVVDYGCPEASGHWVEEHFPQVDVVRSAESPRFETRPRPQPGRGARADRRGFASSMPTRAWRPISANASGPCWPPGASIRPCPAPSRPGARPSAQRRTLRRVGGYDEVIQGWGREDDDFYARLLPRGCPLCQLPRRVAAGDQATPTISASPITT